MHSDVHPKDQLLDFVYDELPDPARSQLESHLRACPECARELEGIRGVRRAASQLPVEAPPDDGLASLLAYAEKAAQRQAEPPEHHRWWGWLSAAGTLVALSLVVLIVFGGSMRHLFGSSADALSGNSSVAIRAQTKSLRTPVEFGRAGAFGGGVASAPPAASPAPKREIAMASKPMAEPVVGGVRGGLADAFASNDADRSRGPSESRRHRHVSRRRKKRSYPARRVSPRLAEVAKARALPAPPAAAPAPALAGSVLGSGRISGAPAARAFGARATSGPSSETLEREVAQTRARIANGAQGDVLAGLLERLCVLEVDLGHTGEARKSCERVTRDFPGSVFAIRAHAALSRLGTGSVGSASGAARSKSPRK